MAETCTCNASTLPHQHTSEGIVDVKPETKKSKKKADEKEADDSGKGE